MGRISRFIGRPYPLHRDKKAFDYGRAPSDDFAFHRLRRIWH